MSDTTDLMDQAAEAGSTASDATAAAPRRRRAAGSGLNGMVLAELQQVAAGLGISGTGRMRKSQLIEAIEAKQAGGGKPADEKPAEAAPRAARAAKTAAAAPAQEPAADSAAQASRIVAMS
ncbi:Rho termination factor N-terminal domain-containing protein, partial [Yinghuangia aomiensis]|uniref:Rho termination factor N-terminal domain-containing protein n=1 Tax=Yinghuangia aomiensis TaxID=676205 RepID=UPI0031EECA12